MWRIQDGFLRGGNNPFADDAHKLSAMLTPLELQPNRTVRPFTVTTDSYISMCSSVYQAMCMHGYGETISESVFQYYAVAALWQQLRHVGYTNIPEAPELQCLCRNVLNFIPSPLDHYIKSIGNYTDPDFCYRQFRMPTSLSNKRFGPVTGTFGPVDANNHYFYEAYPAPGIAALRILADLKYTENPCPENLIWDLPLDLRPKENCRGISPRSKENYRGISPRPTRNLLGWAPAQRLTESQVQFLREFQVTPESFPTICKLHCQNNLLLNAIWRTFGEIRTFPKHFYTDYKGSVAQGISLGRSYDDSEFDRNAMYCEGRVSASSYRKFNNNFASGAMIAGYRMFKQSIDDKHCWSCYDFNDYKDVPASWIETRNRIYEWGSVGTLNEPLLTSIPRNKKMEQKLIIQHAQSIPSVNWNVFE